VNNEEFYLSTMDSTHTSNSEPSADIELDTAEGKIISVEAYGDTYQQTYKGINLLPPTANFQETVADVNVLYENGVFTISGTATGSGGQSTTWREPIANYTIEEGDYWQYKNDFVSQQMLIQLRFTDNTTFAQTINTEDIIIDLSSYVGKTIKDYRLYFQSGYDFNGTMSPMIVKSSTSAAFEPYVGGVPVPNPDYPQTVNVVTGEQNTLVTGKNLFSTEFSTDFTATSNNTFTLHRTNLRVTRFFFPYDLPAGTYTLSFKIASTTASQGLNLNFFDADDQQMMNISTIKTTPYSRTITLPRPLHMLYTFIQTGDKANSSITIEDFQIEQGETATDFAPYQGVQSYTVDLGATELCKIGDYQDYIYKSGDDWYMHKVIDKISFNGTETWGQVNSYAYFSTTISDDIIKPNDIYAKPLILSNNYLSASRSNLYDSAVNYGIGVHENTPSRILIRNKDYTSIPAFTTWLSNHNTTVYYPLTTPTDTKITDSTLIGQLDALAGADTSNEKTYIKVTATDPNLPALLKVEAYKY
jgi:hypothetical protein